MKKMKKEASVDQTTVELVRSVVFNYIQEEAPDLSQEFEQTFTFTKSSLRLQEVLKHVKMVRGEKSKEGLVRALVLGYLGREAPGLVGKFRERVGQGETQG